MKQEIILFFIVINTVLIAVLVGFMYRILRQLAKQNKFLYKIFHYVHFLNSKLDTIMTTEQGFTDVLARIDTATSNVAAELLTVQNELKNQGLPADTEASILAKLQSAATKLESIGKPETPAGAGTPATAATT